jgi:hypothetical protein
MCADPPHTTDDFSADAVVRMCRSPGRVNISQFVELDHPVDDGSGDGPYRASGIGLEYLEPADQ